MKNKVCCIFNLAPHYRAPIYHLMDRELGCDFYFGDKVDAPIKLMDYKSLKGFKAVLRNTKVLSSNYWWQKGAVKLLIKPYRKYIITGSPNVLSNWIILILAKVLGKKVYAWTHGMKGNRSPKRTLFEKLFYSLCYKILLYGNYSKKVMKSKGFDDNKLVTIYNSLDHTAQLNIRDRVSVDSIYNKHFGNSFPIVIYIGRIQKSKKLGLLVEAIKQLNEQNEPCNLVFIGKSVDGNELISQVSNLNLENFTWFYGPCYDEMKIGNLIHNADVCVSPGPVGLTAIHSMSFGTPVITNDLFNLQMPEFEVIEEGKNGAFFKNDDLQDLVEKISNWIALNTLEREATRKYCYNTIDNNWNPNNQIKILKSALKI